MSLIARKGSLTFKAMSPAEFLDRLLPEILAANCNGLAPARPSALFASWMTGFRRNLDRRNAAPCGRRASGRTTRAR